MKPSPPITIKINWKYVWNGSFLVCLNITLKQFRLGYIVAGEISALWIKKRDYAWRHMANFWDTLSSYDYI